MRVVIQRVTEASVSISGQKKSDIERGLMILVGIEDADSLEDVLWLSKKICNLRIFDDDNGVMNRSVLEIKGDILVVSQFTLHARVKKGSRPSYVDAARPEVSIPIYKSFLEHLEKDLGKEVAAGEFGAEMEVKLINDGPVTILIDTKNRL